MEFQLLGDVQARHDGRRVPLGGNRQRCVLTVLLLEPGRVVPVSRIIARAWPADPPDTASALVTSYISRLRSTLAQAVQTTGEAGGTRRDEPVGEVELVSSRPGYLIRIDPEKIDAHRFSALVRQARRDRQGLEPAHAASKLREALALWQGSALADLDSPWLGAQRVRLEDARLDAVEELTEIELETGDIQGSLALARRLAQAHPERERLATLTVRALDASGESSQAVELASRTVRALRHRGLEPSAALTQAQLDALRPKSGTRRPRTATAHAQLPPDTSAFTGRTEELEDLAAMVVDGRVKERVVLCAVDGMAGIGKTAFAVHAAHLLAEHFPDGQLFIDLHAFTPGMEPIRPEAALDRMLRTLGVAPQHVPQDADERAALYRDRLALSRMLIVLDNAGSEAQIRPLLPGAPGCLVLITGRRRLAGLDDAHSIRLDVLPDADARTLFTAVAGPARVGVGDAALAETITLCGRIPLAIRIAAARLRNRPAWPTGYLAARLRDESQRLSRLDDGERSLAATFTVSYDHLTGEEQRMFRHLGLHPGSDIDVYSASALADAAPETTDILLEALVDHNLLIQPSTGRYQMHDLVRIHARTLADTEPPTERRSALCRLLGYYLHTARTADQLLARSTVNHAPPVAHRPAAMPEMRTDDQAAAWMEAERANLTAAVDYAARHDFPADTIGLPTAMHSALRIQGHWILAERLELISLDAARRAQDRTAQANALYCLGEVQTVMNQYSQAAGTLGEALDLYRSVGERRGQANAYASLARVRRLTAHLAQAEMDVLRALSIYLELRDELGRANAFATLGGVQKLTGQYADAQGTLEAALVLYERLGHRFGQAEALTDLGEVQQLTGQYVRAADTLSRALDLFRQLGYRLGQAEALTYLGGVRQLTGKYTEAEETLRQALTLHQQLGNRMGEAEALSVLGTVEQATGQYYKALGTLQRSVALHKHVDHRLGQAGALTALADVQRAMGRQGEAAESHRQALDLYHQIEKDL